MNVEQRLVEVFQTSTRIEPTPDLFSRVVHSIEEDRRHRRRVAWTAGLLAAACAALVTVGALSLEGGPSTRHVHRPTMEMLEIVALVLIVVGLGPAIRRFGRNYAADHWPAGSITPRALLRLLDVAYYLVGAGYILLTVELQFGRFDGLLADQLADASARVGGLLLALGVLHATTLFVLPVIAFVDNATRTRTTLPKWIILLLLVGAWVGVNWVPLAVALGMSG